MECRPTVVTPVAGSGNCRPVSGPFNTINLDTRNPRPNIPAIPTPARYTEDIGPRRSKTRHRADHPSDSHEAVAISIVILFLVGAAAYWFWPASRGPAELKLPGTVEIQEVRLGSRIAGRVSTVPIHEGQVVEPGTVLFTLEPFEWSAKREQVRQRLATAKADLDKAIAGPLPEEVAEAKGAMEAAKARLDRAKTGYREEQKRQAKADLEASEADQRKAEDDLARLTKAKPEAVSQSEIDQATAAQDAARGRAKSLKAMLDMMITGSRVEDIDEARADYNRTSAHYEFLKRGTREEDEAAAYAAVKVAEASLAEAEVNCRKPTVAAPEKCVGE